MEETQDKKKTSLQKRFLYLHWMLLWKTRYERMIQGELSGFFVTFVRVSQQI